MGQNILTWDDKQQHGALQIDLGEEGIFCTDVITQAPLFSFPYTNFVYVEQEKLFKVDGKEMTAKQKAEVLTVLKAVIPNIPFEWYKRDIIGVPQRYLDNTDKFVIRKLETDEELPEGMAKLRAEAREYVDKVRDCNTQEQLLVLREELKRFQ